MIKNDLGSRILYKNKSWGAETDEGEVQIPFIYEFLRRVPGIIFARKNGKWGIIDNNNKTIVPIVYDDIISFTNYFLVNNNGKWGIINKQGVSVTPLLYDSAMPFFQCHGNSVLGIVDYRLVGIPWYMGRIDGINECEDTIIVQKNGKYGLINNQGKNIVSILYDFISSFYYIAQPKISNKYFKAKKDGRWGCIDSKNTIIIPFEYDDIKYIFEEYRGLFLGEKGFLLAGKDNIWYCIKIDGGCVVSIIRDISPNHSFGYDGYDDFMQLLKDKGLIKINCSQIDKSCIEKHTYIFNPD